MTQKSFNEYPVACPHCGQVFVYSHQEMRSFAGQQVECTSCSGRFLLPTSGSAKGTDQKPKVMRSSTQSTTTSRKSGTTSSKAEMPPAPSRNKVVKAQRGLSQSRGDWSRLYMLFGMGLLCIFAVSIWVAGVGLSDLEQIILNGLSKVFPRNPFRNETFQSMLKSLIEFLFAPRQMVVYLLTAISTAWIFHDATSRQSRSAGLFAIGTFFLPFVTIPYYLATRHLREGEVREGGFAWNVIGGFTIVWTIGIVAMCLAILVEMSLREEFPVFTTRAAMVWMLSLWAIPITLMLPAGYLLKKQSIVEKGPTGPFRRGSGADNAKR